MTSWRRWVVGLVGLVLAGATPSAAAAVQAAPPAVSWQASGNPYLFALGDSLLEQCGQDFGVGWRSLGYVAVPGATTVMLRERLQGKPVPAHHHWTITESSVEEERTWFRDAGALVVSLGVNDSKEMTPQQFAGEVDWYLGQSRGRPVVWVNAHDATDPRRVAPYNDVLAAATARYPNLKVLDWTTFARTNPQHTRGDGVHLADTAACDAYKRLIATAVPAVPGQDSARGYWYGTQYAGHEFVLNGWATDWTNPRLSAPQINVRVDWAHFGRWPVRGLDAHGDLWAAAASGRAWEVRFHRWGGTRTVCLDAVDSKGRFTALGCRVL